MFDVERIALVGATGLIGRKVIDISVGREDLRLTALARREVKLPEGAKMELFVADPAKWGEVFEAIRPVSVICALGTTWRKSGKEEAAFRAVDHDLVLKIARAAINADVKRFVAISSVGADALSKNFYLKTKGETDRELMHMKFDRLDILRPGLLRGFRGMDLRPAEQVGQMLGPVANLAMHGGLKRYRSIPADTVAKACLALAMRKARGRFRHEYEAIVKAANSLPAIGAD
ncbi:NAD(P)H-binding protein [Qipengyuania oceanensis]|uniref:NAD(P)H-binding protein n=1 Tax=Qipengyuania oceanensis TaxID=1463597 RepID=A0A844YEJ3_9SPHN|nr:NAD(P)H-binding protein [Qipengyuania oceanensis]MXO63516.1 NAD(P)H-binding protein [Qipengyuania oceanensis]